MAYVIAVAGKGGVGKTTFSGLLVQHLCAAGKKPVLAVDADANSNLNEVLGVEPLTTLGDVREELEMPNTELLKIIPEGMTVEEYTAQKLDGAITKGEDYDLLVMGRSQGKECYCYINSLLSRQVQRIESNYNYMLVDNEAGMEHINRGVLPKVDAVILVSDGSRRGIQAAGRIAKLVEQYKLNPSVFGLVVNRVPDGILDEGSAEEITNQGLNLIGVIPEDDAVFQYDSDGEPLVNLPEDSPARVAMKNIFDKIAL